MPPQPPRPRRQADSEDMEIAVVERQFRTDQALPVHLLQKARDILAASDALRRADLGEQMARRYAAGSLQILWDIASNEAVEPEVRRKSAVNLVEFAYGKPATVLRLPDGGTGSPTIDAEIAEAESAAQSLMELSEMANIPPDEWPDSLKASVLPLVHGIAKSESE